jgi:sugar lactone lactonase YvrE
MAEIFCEMPRNSQVTSPVVDPQTGDLFFACQGTGEIATVQGEGEAPQIWNNTNGQPSGIGIDSDSNIYVADLARGAILSVSPGGEQQLVVKVYEDKPFKGPNSVVFDKAGTMYFTDSGPMGETSLANPTGSVYCITGSQVSQLVRWLVS